MYESLISIYEKRLAEYIDESLNAPRVKVVLWADAFNTENTVKTRNQIFFGHQRTERTGYTVLGSTLVYVKRIYFEVRVELFSLRNHQNALNLIEHVIDSLLAGYQPYCEFRPFYPNNSGQASRNPSNGSWIYTGDGYTEILSDVKTLSEVSDNTGIDGTIVKLNIQNAYATNLAEAIIGEFTHQEVTNG